MATEPIPLSGLARRLVDDGVVDPDVAIDATEEARKSATPLVSYLVQNDLADANVIASSAAEEFGVPLMDLASFDLDSIPKDLVKEQLIRQHNALPLCAGECGSSSRSRTRPTCRHWTKSVSDRRKHRTGTG